MELFQRVKQVSKELAKSETKLASMLDLPQRTLNGYLNEKSQRNLWEYLPKILELFPQIRREWLWWGEGSMLKGDLASGKYLILKSPYLSLSQLRTTAWSD